MESAEVVIVGGGALGSSVAWHLAELGITDVVLLERDTLGSGSTSKSAGGFRMQFGDELNVRIAQRSLAELVAMGDEIELHQWGYLFLLDRDDDVAAFRGALAMQQSLGVPARELTPSEALDIVPQLDLDGVLAATYCALDGYCSPENVVQWYARGAAAHGVRIKQGCALEAVRVRNGRIESVETSAGSIATGTVVCTAGAWSAEVGGLAGVALPVEGMPRHLWYTPDDGGLPRELPLTIDFSTSFYFHREGQGLVFGGREPGLEEVAEHAARRLPVLTELPIQSSWWGYYEDSPDHNALVGESDRVSRFLYATGFSGHGFQQAPAAGEHVAELVAGGAPTLDLSALDAGRFARGTPRRETVVI
ncbi:MAG TPA: FAD-binding oxidoreductase [Gaiellaceae bacterium]|nr:FAD-binding oxidoreductase [Gaiellaceae bacterium]